MEKRELVYMDAKSKKFWNIELDGSSHTVKYGRIGTDGQASSKDFPSEEKARASMEKLVKQKLSKGYLDAEGAGASADGVDDSSGEIPLIAFNSIVHREHVFENAGTFVGQNVVDYDPEKKAKSDVAYRFRSDWEEDNLMSHLEHYLETDAALEPTALVIGNWSGDDPEVSPEFVIAKLAESKDRLPNLAAIYIGDITQEENEMSWINQADLSPILASFPKLQFLRSRGGEGLELKSPKHDNLRALTMETGGMDVSVIRSLGTAEFPNLEHLELWLGTEDYGATARTPDLQPLLTGALFPKLKSLGLRNSEIVDEVAAVVVNSPVIEQLEFLDLSLGTLTDEGGKALLNLKDHKKLKRLNLHYNYFSAGMLKELKALPFAVDTSRPGDMEDEEDDRFVAVGE